MFKIVFDFLACLSDRAFVLKLRVEAGVGVVTCGVDV